MAPVNWNVQQACVSTLHRVSEYVADGGYGAIFRCEAYGMIGERLVFVANARSDDWGCEFSQYVFFEPEVDMGIGRALTRIERLEN